MGNVLGEYKATCEKYWKITKIKQYSTVPGYDWHSTGKVPGGVFPDVSCVMHDVLHVTCNVLQS